MALSDPQRPLQIAFDSLDELRSACATFAKQGLFVPGLTVTPGQHLLLELSAGLRRFPGQRAVPLAVSEDGVLLALKPTAELREAIRPARRRTVLVIDDEAIWRAALSRALTQEGWDVRLAADGREGMKRLIDGYFELDCVVVDLHMPAIDGKGVLERVRALGHDERLKIVLFTSDPDAARSSGADRLADAVLSKTAPLSELIAQLSQTVRQAA